MSVDIRPRATSVYVPGRALQASEIPIQVLWNPTEDTLRSLRVESSLPVSLVETHNIGVAHQAPGQLDFRGVAVEGYAGLVLSVPRLDVGHEVLHLSITIDFTGHTERFPREVRLFRPQLEVVATPRALVVEREQGVLAIREPRIKIQNSGEGTAIAEIEIFRKDGTKAAVTPPPAITVFQEAFRKDLETRLPALSETHPDHASLIGDLVPMLFIPSNDLPLPERLRKMDAYLAKLVDAIERDESLYNSLSEAVAWAYTKNVDVTGNVNDFFVEYMNSITTSRVILSNPLDTLALTTAGPNEFRLRLVNTDLAQNDYEPLELGEVTLASSDDVALPIHRLFDFVGQSSRSSEPVPLRRPRHSPRRAR